VGTRINFQDVRGQPSEAHATVLQTNDEGHRRLRFGGAANITDLLTALGEVPLPPYIIRADNSLMEQDRRRYQTVFAQRAGSVAAPTAGLHFSEALLAEASARGVQVCFLTLHIGLGTFAPVRAATLAAHVMHEERYELSPDTARIINRAKSDGRRVVAVGTTTFRVLETLAIQATQSSPKTVAAGAGRTRLFIHPPHNFTVADALVTNFHLPRSTLLMLVSAFAAPNKLRGRDLILSAYAEAIRERYRFFSYGDAMLVL
jgi:S-adenosylmethionine:tRNA ribosyltransferase-isomerase